MELSPHVLALREQLAVAAAAGGEEARALAERLTAALDAAVRLMLLDVLAAAAAEITQELAPGSVELRLRTGAPEFVVALPPAEPIVTADAGPGAAGGSHGSAVPGGAGAATEAHGPGRASPAGEGGVARINLRLPDELKARVEQAADREGLSINAWLVRAAAAAATGAERRAAGGDTGQPAATGGQRYRGWGR